MTIAIRTEGFVEADDRLTGLLEALFRPTGVPGVYGRTGLYEDVVERLASFITRHREPGTEVLRFPPVMSRRTLERSGYLKSFPNLLGCMCALSGSDAEIKAAVDTFEAGGDWTDVARSRRSRSHAGGLLPGLSHRGPARSAAGGRPSLRCGERLLPPRALPSHRPFSVVPHARICLHRHARRGRGVSARPGWKAPRPWPIRSA